MAPVVFTAHPEDFSGLWEASDGRGGVVGIDLILLTELPVSATSSAGVSQRVKELEVGVYHRHGPIRFGDEHFFTSESRGGGVELQGDRLWMPLTAGVAVDLLRDASGAWFEWLQEQDFSGRPVWSPALTVLISSPAHVSGIRPLTFGSRSYPTALCAVWAIRSSR